MAPTRTGRRRCASVPARSTRSSTSVIIISTVGVMMPLNAAARPGDTTPPKMPTASSTAPRRADSASRRMGSGGAAPPLAAFGTCSIARGMPRMSAP